MQNFMKSSLSLTSLTSSPNNRLGKRAKCLTSLPHPFKGGVTVKPVFNEEKRQK